jgi:tRNA pseudouridine38-40 synthase
MKKTSEINIFANVEYDGTNYFGFQIQNKKVKNEPTVQELIEKALHKLFKEKIRIAYGSRTDRGVHARAQGINFKVKTSIPQERMKVALNSFLPSDIRITKVKKVSNDFHSRFWTKSKIYRYIIDTSKTPGIFMRNYCWHIPQELDLKKMEKAAKLLVGKKDFGMFAKDRGSYHDCRRNITKVILKKRSKYLYIDIEGDGFLRNMARNMVAFMVKVAKNEISLKDAKLIISGKTPHINKPAPACGLYLFKTSYRTKAS